MRDHQPTGGYPRIATIVGADLDRFAQLRPGTPVTFLPVSR
jgi:allophanate hydrolase subunit 2